MTEGERHEIKVPSRFNNLQPFSVSAELISYGLICYCRKFFD